MKKIYLIISLLFLITRVATAQCTIDSTQTIPGAYPDTISDATVNHPYTQDITFVMVTDTLGFTITNYHIDGITGLPFGFSWACNNMGSGCNYDPSVNLYGCINLSGTTLIAGSYMLNITIIATIAGVGDQALNYFLPLNVVPDTVGNAGFSMTNATGCDPLTVSYINNLPGQVSYLWDFGNGNTDTTENPGPQIYNGPGDYVVTQTITPLAPTQYYLTEVTVDSIPDHYNLGGFPPDNDPDPDMYIVITDTAGNTVYDSHPAIDDTQPPYTWTLPNIPLLDEMYTIQVFDLDSFIINLGDDDLGQVSFAGWGTSGSGTDTVPGFPGTLNLSYTIVQMTAPPIVYTDTVHVLASPAVPVVTASGPLTFCDGDSVTLTSSAATDNQWFETITLMPGDTNQSLVVKISGVYSVMVSSLSGCTSSSLYDTVTVNPLPTKPPLQIIADSIYCSLSGFNLQWYLNGNIINGATGQFFDPVVSGTYTVIATDGNGCTNISDPLLFQGVGIDEQQLIGQLVISPNPSSGVFNINFEPLHPADLQLNITDVTGRLVYEKALYRVSGNYSMQLDLGFQQTGIYLLEITGNGESIKRKLILTGQD